MAGVGQIQKHVDVIGEQIRDLFLEVCCKPLGCRGRHRAARRIMLLLDLPFLMIPNVAVPCAI